MDAHIHLQVERDRLEAALLGLEQEWLSLMPEDDDALGLCRDQDRDRGLRIASLLSSLGLVNAELAAMRHRGGSGLRP
jgi:hypothetical protein